MDNKEKFLQIFRDQFKETDPMLVGWDTDVVKIDEWSSLMALFVSAAIGEEFGVNITALELKASRTPGDLYRIVEGKIGSGAPEVKEQVRISLEKSVEITMPQMAVNALSESWLYKELGDIHWELLSKGLGQKSSRFQDEDGNRLYATFVRISMQIDQLANFRENDVIDFDGSVKKYGNSAYISDINGVNGAHKLHANMITIFSIRNANDNSRIEKSKPVTNTNNIEELTTAPDMLNEYYALKRDSATQWPVGEFMLPVSGESVWEDEYIINPFTDINGVGLLYFAAYPVISDYKTRFFYSHKFGDMNHELDYTTIARDINYFSNCNVTDTIIFRVNSFEQDGRHIKTMTSLYRKSDGALLAKIFTVKAKNH